MLVVFMGIPDWNPTDTMWTETESTIIHAMEERSSDTLVQSNNSGSLDSGRTVHETTIGEGEKCELESESFGGSISFEKPDTCYMLEHAPCLGSRWSWKPVEASQCAEHKAICEKYSCSWERMYRAQYEVCNYLNVYVTLQVPRGRGARKRN